MSSSGGFVVIMVLVMLIGFGIQAARATVIADKAERIGEDRRRYFWRAFNSREPRTIEETLELKGQLMASERRAAEERRRARRHREGNDAVGPERRILPAEPRTPAERMKDLQDLYRQGLIGEDEFATKRREILGEV